MLTKVYGKTPAKNDALQPFELTVASDYFEIMISKNIRTGNKLDLTDT